MFRYLKISELILINQYGQKIIIKEKLIEWFLSLTDDEKRDTINDIWILAVEAGIIESDVNEAIKRANLKPTNTPVVMLINSKLPFRQRGGGHNFKGSVQLQAFLLNIECLTIADERRRNLVCKGSCSHWWHKDLSSEKVIKEILNNHL
jgi:hypothetical protein